MSEDDFRPRKPYLTIVNNVLMAACVSALFTLVMVLP
jgi:hypothetical protein